MRTKKNSGNGAVDALCIGLSVSYVGRESKEVNRFPCVLRRVFVYEVMFTLVLCSCLHVPSRKINQATKS